MQYKLQLQTLKKDNLSMREYLNKVKLCCDMLGSAGYKVPEEDQILHILSGLGSEYDSVMVTITSKSENWSIQNVQALLMSFESRLESFRGVVINTDRSQPSANIFTHSFNRRNGPLAGQGNRDMGYQGNNQNNRGGKCGRGRGRSQGHRTSCQVCKKPGHTAYRCWHRFDHNYKGQNQPQQQPARQPFHQGNFTNNPTLNVAHLPAENTQSEHSYDGSWYPYSGATHHVSYDLSNFNILSEYHGNSRLHMGNGMGVDIANIGNSFLKSHFHSKNFFLNNLLHVPNDDNVSSEPSAE
ncbi:hypothetical protein C2S52_002248 [Perilla frutescens var. hirtella]|nr:hypothetical protein C2S52_002248 [Perilla frutescens var. hirtella]